jgi:hypothetical protein
MASDELQFRALKLLYNAGTHGVLQKHLFERLPKVRTANLLNTMAALQAAGFAAKATSRRATSRWGYLWTITETGKREYVRLLAGQNLTAAVPVPA